MSFPSQAQYEQLIYALPQNHACVVSSSLRLYTTSRGTALVRGSIHFESGLELRVTEILDFVTGRISDYSYTVFRGTERIRWYDPQPHPEQRELESTFPHHYHMPPDIKHNRLPAAGISFAEPNLPKLVEELAHLT